MFSFLFNVYQINDHTIGASDYDMEAVSPLTFVIGLHLRDRGAPQSALVVGCAGRVGTIVGVGVNAGIPFKVHVERFATVGLVTQRCTSKRVKALQSVQAHVFGGTERSVLVDKDLRVAIRGRGIGCDGLAFVNSYSFWEICTITDLKSLISRESLSGIWSRNWP